MAATPIRTLATISPPARMTQPRVVRVHDAIKAGSPRRMSARVVVGVDRDVLLPLIGQLVLGKARVHRARLNARVAIDALLRIDVELRRLVKSPPRPGRDGCNSGLDPVPNRLLIDLQHLGDLSDGEKGLIHSY
jgi:hypothetical protein